MDIDLIVRDLIKTYETQDPYKLCKYLDIHVRFSKLGKIKGIYKKIRNHKFIAVNEDLLKFEKVVVLSHELGHAIVHDYNDVIMMKTTFVLPKHGKFEREANIFAANLLISDDYIGRFEPEDEDDQDLYDELLNYI